jgi:hypothetical protein
MRFEQFLARSGGMGGGNLPKQEFKPPKDWIPKIIKSTVRGVEIKLPPPAPTASSGH